MVIKQKKIYEVADHGTYEIEVTSVINTNTMNAAPLFSLMSHENISSSSKVTSKNAISYNNNNYNNHSLVK